MKSLSRVKTPIIDKTVESYLQYQCKVFGLDWTDEKQAERITLSNNEALGMTTWFIDKQPVVRIRGKHDPEKKSVIFLLELIDSVPKGKILSAQGLAMQPIGTN